MKFFKLPKKRIDERLENSRNKIYKEIYLIISVICAVSLVIKTYILETGVEGIVLELLILLVSGVYFLARSIFMGLYWDEVELHDRKSKVPMSRKGLYMSGGFALVIAIFMGINSAVSYADSGTQGLWYFVLVSFVSIMIYLPILLILSGGVYVLAKKFGIKSDHE